MNDLIGKELGPYRILEQIGAGGMATVYKAYHAAMDRHVAVKVLPEQMSTSAELRKRFDREAKVIARLEHTHILPVHDYGQAGNWLYLVMRHIEAGTLKDRLEAGPMDLSEVNRVMRQVGGALDYAHRLGVVHRDVKPSNVLLDDQGNCYLTDFGLARMMEASVKLTATGVGMGTPAYMSPEQGQGEKVDARSDIYSLGVMLYEMVTGRVPYEAETPMAVVLKHITAPLPLPREIKPDLPRAVERVILRAMAKNPDDRFQTAEEMVAALDAAVRRMGPEMPPLPSAPPREGFLARAMAGLRYLPQTAWGRVAMWAAVGAIALLVFFLVLSQVPLKVQIRGGQLEVVRVVEATPTSVATVTARVTATTPATATPATPVAALPTSESLPVAQPTATETPPLSPTPTTAPPTPTSTHEPTATPLPPSPTAVPATNLNVIQLALYEDAASHFAWSPDGKSLAIAASKIILYDAQSAKTQEISSSSARYVAFSPDGSLLAAVTYEGVTLWDVASWGILRTLAGSGDTESVAFSPDGATLATATGSTVKLWDVATGDERRTIPAGGSVRSVAFSPDGRTLAAEAGHATVKLWDAETGSELHTLTGHSNWITSVAFSPDGQTLASGSVDSTVRLWDVASARQLWVFTGHTNQVEGISFSPDGTLLASVSWDLTVRLWDVASGAELANLTGHSGWITCVAFSPDGTVLASGSGDQMRLWRVAFEKETTTAPSLTEQARAFAEPILAAVADRPPDFEDDFSTADKGWEVHDQEGSFAIEEGVARFSVGVGGLAIKHGALIRKDFVLQMDARLITGDMASEMSVNFHTVASGYWYHALLRSGQRAWEVQRATEPQMLASGVGNVSPLGETTQIIIVARGPRAAVYLNGVPVAYFEDADFDTAGTTFLSCESFSESVCEFDNVKLWNLETVPGLP